ncbi:MAG: hypothetical protein A2Y38_20090 [Spirochaetes bacterium GWB1_59_5]|nr:MAG: hypothetical protein A2Y38_20090 [Spirochaetes bacterium GWB1_59_5]
MANIIGSISTLVAAHLSATFLRYLHSLPHPQHAPSCLADGTRTVDREPHPSRLQTVAFQNMRDGGGHLAASVYERFAGRSGAGESAVVSWFHLRASVECFAQGKSVTLLEVSVIKPDLPRLATVKHRLEHFAISF